MDCIQQWIGRCLHSQMAGVIARLAPEGRDQSMAMNKWREVVEAEKKKKERMSKAMTKFSPEGRAKGKALHAWLEMAKEKKKKQAIVAAALARMTPEGRAKYKGLSAFKSRTPCWDRAPVSQQGVGGPTFLVNKDAFWVTHVLHRQRESAFGTPIMTRGLFRFAFKISGSGAGMVVGVADATDRFTDPSSDPTGWGLHLTHGALYTKRANSEKGVLSTKQLCPQMVSVDEPIEDEEGLTEHKCYEVEVEVDMDRRRIAFGQPGEQLVEAPVKLSSTVRPWVYMWEEGDAVMLDSRPVPQRAHMTRYRKRMAADAKPPTPLRQKSSPVLPRVPATARQPSHAETGDYLPSYTYDMILPPDDAPVETPSNAGAKTHPPRSLSPAAAIRSATLSARAIMYSPEGRRLRRAASAAATGQISPPKSKAASSVASVTDAAMSSRRGRRRFRSPGRSPGRSPATEPMGYAEPRTPGSPPRSPRSPRENKGTHMWDMVRYVSGVYSDVYKTI